MKTTFEVTQELITSLLNYHNLNWEVKKEPLSIVTEKFVPIGWLSDPSHSIEETKFFAITRQDTRTHFATCQAEYEVFQNSELMELALRVADTLDIEIVKAGVFNGGSHVYIQMLRGKSYIRHNSESQNDCSEVERIITVANSHDTTGALRWGTGNRTIGCMNVYWSLYRGLKNKIRHTRNMREMVEESVNVLEELEQKDQIMMSGFQTMANTGATRTDVRDVILAVTGVDQFISLEDAEEIYSTNKINKSKDLYTCITQEMNDKGCTLWGLFSGVTYYTTHMAGKDVSREKHKFMGSHQATDMKVCDMLINRAYNT